MRYFFTFLFLIFVGCSPKLKVPNESRDTTGNVSQKEIVLAFGSCNKHDEDNVFWDDILATRPDLFIWGGDNIYADTEDMELMKEMYTAQKAVAGYATLMKTVPITGTWDDHDYGLNDGGFEFRKKRESQRLFLDFLDVPETDLRRKREGVYSSQIIERPLGSVKIINLDTRYFRTPLTKSSRKDIRYEPNTNGEGTILGEEQWKWLGNELSTSTSDFNLIVSSIQFLSDEHGFEKWANYPHEVVKMKELIVNSKAKGVLFLSGDRHISEFSKLTLRGLPYPLVDFTSSGLTHSYEAFEDEPNPYRIGHVVSSTSFGLLRLDLVSKRVLFQIRGENGKVFEELLQEY